MADSCIFDDCDTPPRARRMCQRHYMQWHRRAYGRHDYIKVAERCIHMDCKRRADIRFTLPPPIGREERACYYHGTTLLNSPIQGITAEDI